MPEVLKAIERILAGAAPKDCESVTLDFKEDKASEPDLLAKIVRAAVCFANSAGGVIVIGVADKTPGAAAFTGTMRSPETLRQRLHEMTKPPLLVDIEVRAHPARLLVVRVLSGSSVHADTQGRAWQRLNCECVPLEPAELMRLGDERRGYDWSAERSDVFASSAQPEALTAARLLLSSFPDERREIARRSDADLLSALGLLSGRVHLSHAGRLLFCAETNAPPVFVYQYKLTPGGEPRLVQRLAQPLALAFPRLMELVAARQTTTPVSMPNGQQITIEDFPTIAVREALSNAICHRDWRAAGGITVDHSPEVFSVTSPGPLVNGVTPENILTMPSRPRNRCLANAVRLLGWAEETGRGVDRMYRETIRSGRRPPNIESFPDRAKVSFVGGAPDTNIARFVAHLPEEEREDTDTMLLLYHLCRIQTITELQAAPLLQKPPIEAGAVLRRLAAEHLGLLEVTRHSAGRKKQVYRLRGSAVSGLGPAVTYNRRTVDDIDRKIIEHIREYGKVTNRTLQNLFDVHVYRARDILSGLQQRDVIIRVSEQTRGSKVEWGAGTKFPHARPQKRNHKNSSTAVDSAVVDGKVVGQTEFPWLDPTYPKP